MNDLPQVLDLILRVNKLHHDRTCPEAAHREAGAHPDVLACRTCELIAAIERAMKETNSAPLFDVTVNGLRVNTLPEPCARSFAAGLFRQAVDRYPAATPEQRASGQIDAIDAGRCAAAWLETGVMDHVQTSHTDPYPHTTVIDVKESAV